MTDFARAPNNLANALLSADSGAHSGDRGAALRETIARRRDEIIAAWLRAVAPYLPNGMTEQELRGRLGAELDRLIELLLSPILDQQLLQQVGASLGDLFGGSAEALQDTQHLIGHHLTAGDANGAGNGVAARQLEVVIGIVPGFMARRHSPESHWTESEPEQPATLAELHGSDARFRAVFESTAIGVAVLCAQGHVLDINPALHAMLGYTVDDLKGIMPARLLYTDDHPGWWEDYRELLAGRRQEVSLEGRLRHRDGSFVWCQATCSLVRDRDGGRRYHVAIIQDITERKRAEQTLRANEERYRQLVQNSSDLTALISDTGDIVYVSPSVERVLGYEHDALLHRKVRGIIADGNRDKLDVILNELRGRPGHTVRTELRVTHRDGTWRWLEVVCTNLLHLDSVGGIVVNARDISDRKAFEERLELQAFLDPLTALPNRVLFRERLERALQRGGEMGDQVAVLFLDLDRFKIINDSLGHGAGDQILVAVGQRILDALDAGDTVARIGGDEFAVLMERGPIQDAWRTADNIIEALNQPIPLLHRSSPIGASIGIAVSGPALEHSGSMLRAADIALYRAKDARGTAVLFEQAMYADALGRLELEADLHLAHDRDELRLFLQPEIDLATGAVVGFDVHARWDRPGHGTMMPSDFMLAAEETGVIVQIGQWALEEASRWLKTWMDDDLVGHDVTINLDLTARQLRQPDLSQAVVTTLRATGLPAGNLRFEVTEDGVVSDRDASTRLIDELRAAGVRFAIGNFGSGTTSLRYLRQMIAEVLKIDRSFLESTEVTDADQAIFQAITTMAHTFGIRVVADGVTSAEQAALVRAAGCDRGQGDHFAASVPAADIPALIASLG